MKLNDEFREKRMTNWLKDNVRWSEGTKQVLRYLNKNSYRKLQKTTYLPVYKQLLFPNKDMPQVIPRYLNLFEI